MSERPDPAQLAESIRGLSDEQLADEIGNLGADGILAAIFEGMREAFRAEKAGGVDATIQYDIDASGDVKPWSVAIKDGICTTSSGAAADPRLTLSLGIVDFVRLIFNQAEGPQLFMTGKLKLKGDMMFAMQMQNFFERPG